MPKSAQMKIAFTFHENGDCEAELSGGPDQPLSGRESAKMFACLIYTANRTLHNFRETIKAEHGEDVAKEFMAETVAELMKNIGGVHTIDETYKATLLPNKPPADEPFSGR